MNIVEWAAVNWRTVAVILLGGGAFLASFKQRRPAGNAGARVLLKLFAFYIGVVGLVAAGFFEPAKSLLIASAMLAMIALPGVFLDADAKGAWQCVTAAGRLLLALATVAMFICAVVLLFVPAWLCVATIAGWIGIVYLAYCR